MHLFERMFAFVHLSLPRKSLNISFKAHLCANDDLKVKRFEINYYFFYVLYKNSLVPVTAFYILSFENVHFIVDQLAFELLPIRYKENARL